MHAAERTECRAPSAAESQAGERVQRALQQAVSGPVTALGWTLQNQKADGGSPDVANDANPKRPLMRCWTIYDAKFELGAGSPHYAALHAQADKWQKDEQDWMAACIKSNYKGCDKKPDNLTLGAHAAAGLNLEIRALENSPYMRPPSTEPLHKLDVPGAAVAYRLQPDEEDLVKTTVCVGSWKPEITFASASREVLFPFQHAPGTPFIENLCLTITGAPDLSDELLHKVDWQQLSAALTR